VPSGNSSPPLACRIESAAVDRAGCCTRPIALFVDRAEAVNPDFALTDMNAQAVALICHRLDGLPLAIELIAARTALISPPSLLDRLHGNLLLRSDGLRDIDTRQKTLFNAIDWKLHLLTPDEQVLFTQLGVFVGGWTLRRLRRSVGMKCSMD
jgi:predicted ATPase